MTTKRTTIGELVIILKGNRSFEELSADCGGIPTSGRLQQISTKTQSTFPNPDTIKGMARGLGITPIRIIAAWGQDLGLWDKDVLNMNSLPVPQGADRFTPSQVSALSAVMREFERSNTAEKQRAIPSDGDSSAA